MKEEVVVNQAVNAGGIPGWADAPEGEGWNWLAQDAEMGAGSGTAPNRN